MSAKACPTCRKTNCGNHAACARRAASRCPRCGKNPCPNQTRCLEIWGSWNIVASVERQMQFTFTPEEVNSWDREMLSLARKAAAVEMDRVLREREVEERARSLAQLMFGGRRR